MFFGFSQSAIQQLEEITGQKIDRSGFYDNEIPNPVPDQQYYNNEYTNYLSLQAHDENESGINAYNNKDWGKAASHFNKALKLNPNEPVYKQNYENALHQKCEEKERKAEEEKYKKVDQTFLKSYNKDVKAYTTQVNSLRKTIAGYVPPIGTPTRNVKEGLMLGLFNTQSDYAFKNIESPTGHVFKEGEYYTGTDTKSVTELVRGIVDNYTLGKYTLNTEKGKELISALNGTHFERLYAHSNGATISEALIREGVITVDELDIMGGDRSYMNFDSYKELINSGKIKKIVVWYNPGDIIPKGSSVKLLHPNVNFSKEYDKIFEAIEDHSLTDYQNGKIQYKKLKGNQYKGQEYKFGLDFFEAHSLESYFYNIKKYYGNN